MRTCHSAQQCNFHWLYFANMSLMWYLIKCFLEI
uniref:Uncharacterized protein n=1 Tax=Anguilla anguilla TaxID=7936 RepID=A0A0E9XIV4_ANGAN